MRCCFLCSEVLKVNLGGFGHQKGRSGGQIGRSWCQVGGSRSQVGGSWAKGGALGGQGVDLGRIWRPTWAALEAKLGVLGPTWEDLGANLGGLGAKLAVWKHLERIFLILQKMLKQK